MPIKRQQGKTAYLPIVSQLSQPVEIVFIFHSWNLEQQSYYSTEN